MKRALSINRLSSLKKKLDSEHILSGLSEKTVLNALLTDSDPNSNFPFLEARDELKAPRLLSHSTASRIRPSVVSETNKQCSEPTTKAVELMHRPAVTSKDLDMFLTSNYLAMIPQSELQDGIDRGLLDLTVSSSPNNIRTLMQYLSKYWQVGFQGVRPSIFQARRQARILLSRSIEIHPATTHEGGGEQIGIPDFWRFEQFVDNFFNYLGAKRSPNDELNELLLRLCAKSGPLETTTSRIMEKTYVDDLTLRFFLDAARTSKPSVEKLLPLKPLFLNEHTGPATIEFLLPYSRSIDDISQLLTIADNSSLKLEVYDQCQTKFVETLETLDLEPVTRLAWMFGILHRIKQITLLTSSTLDAALEVAISAQSPPAVKRLLNDCSHASRAVLKAKKYVHIN